MNELEKAFALEDDFLSTYLENVKIADFRKDLAEMMDKDLVNFKQKLITFIECSN